MKKNTLNATYTDCIYKLYPIRQEYRITHNTLMQIIADLNINICTIEGMYILKKMLENHPPQHDENYDLVF